jgi:hypothetical protein
VRFVDAAGRFAGGQPGNRPTVEKMRGECLAPEVRSFCGVRRRQAGP